MRCLNCGVCCKETEMLLCQEDIKLLEKNGYQKESFARFDKAGYAILRNRQGNCVFYDPKKHRCNVYTMRPSGCRVYPVIYDEDKGIIIDNICHAQDTVSEQEKQRKGKQVAALLKRIDNQAQQKNPK